MLNDEAIIEMYFARDEQAISASDAKYGAYCRTIAENILNDRRDAEECVNDTWLRAWGAIPPQCPNALKLFFARITRNLSFNRYRASAAKTRGAFCEVLDELEYCIGSNTVDERLDAAELADSINRFLAVLDARERGIFLRRYFFSERTAAIAKQYGLRRGTVNTILSSTRKKLKDHLCKEGIQV